MVHKVAKREFVLTTVYGLNQLSGRQVLWHQLQWLAQSITLPWVCGRDFNNILWAHERQGGTSSTVLVC